MQINQRSNLLSTMQTIGWAYRSPTFLSEASMLARPKKSAFSEGKMMQPTVRRSAIAAIVPAWLLSVAILISGATFNVAQAQNNSKRAIALACGKELKKQCSGVPMQANNMLECLKKGQENLSERCVTLANSVARMCDRDAAQRCAGVVAGSGNVLGCLTTARRSVSARCNAALDAAFLR